MTLQSCSPNAVWAHVRGICFDLGGTLVRPDECPTTGQVGHVLGIRLDEARRMLARDAKRRRTSPEALARDLAADVGRPALAGPLAHVLRQARRRAAQPELFPDAAPTLTMLRRRGFRVLASTNSLGSSIPDEPPEVFGRLLDTVIYSADTGAVKPEREAFAAVERTVGLTPNQLLHVGDSLRADVAGAARAGWHTAWLNRDLSGDPLLGPARTVRLHTLATLPLLLPAAPTKGSSMTPEAR